MKRYSEEFKEKTVRQMMPPSAVSVAELGRKTGVSVATLYKWRNTCRKEGKAVPANASNPENWSGETKLAVLIETGALNVQELSEYCRKKGLYVEQIERWRAGAIAGNETKKVREREAKKALQAERKKSRGLEKELKRKDKALAEVAALLVLKKKAQALWGEPEDG